MDRDLEAATGLARSLLEADESSDGIARVFVGAPRLIHDHWVFGYNSRRYVEDGDVMAAFAGNGPIAVPVDATREPFRLLSSTPAESQLELSRAVIAYVGYDTDTAIPGRHPDRIADLDLRRRVLKLVAAVDREDPGEQPLFDWGDQVAASVSRRYPQLSSDALDALKALVTFEWR